jgi:outer membrane receptor protein involved in Fe transport
VVVALFVAALPPLAAQGATRERGRGALAGQVRDAATGRPIAEAIVLVHGTLLRATTDARGAYEIRDVAAGVYTVQALFLGYRSASRSGVEVKPGATRRVDLALDRAAVALPEVTVTASRRTQATAESPASEAIIAGREITARNAITVADVLPFVPGVTLNHGDLDIRGATGVAGGVGSRVLMLLDGHPVLSADGGEVDFTALPLLDIDRVEVVKGAYSALYGSNALGGVVNVITTPIAPDPETAVNVHYGVYDIPSEFRFTSQRLDFKGIDVQHSRRLGELGARLLVGRESSDGFRQDDQSSRWLLHSKLVFPEDHPHAATADIVWSSEDDGNAFMWQGPNEPYVVPPATAGDWSHSEKLSVGATITPVANGSHLLEIQPYLEHDATRNHFADNHDFHRAMKIGTTAQLVFNPSAWQTITVGGEAARTGVVSNFLDRPGTDTVSTGFLGKPTLTDLGAYVQDELSVSPRLTGTFGARLDYHHVRSLEGASTEVTVNPKLGVVFRPSDEVSVRASVARGYRGPSAIEQFVSTTQSGFRVVPNPSLEGERAWSSEVGAAAEIGSRVWLDGALFQSDYYGLIGPAPAPGQPFMFQFRNVQRARIRGADVAARTRLLADHVSAQLSYMYLDSRDLETMRPLPYRSLHTITGTVDVLGGLMGVDVRYRSRVQQVLAFPLDPRTDITLVDLRLGYRLFDTLVQAKISNLLQAKYVDVMERTPGAPRNVLVTALRNF